MAAMLILARRFSASCRSLGSLMAPEGAGRVEHDPGEHLGEGEDELARLVQLHPGHGHDGIRDLLRYSSVPCSSSS